MYYLILSVMIGSNAVLTAADTLYHLSENPLVVELELCIQTGACLEDLERYQEPLHHLPLDKIAEIQASCEQYAQAIATAYELHKNELLTEYVGLMEQQRAQEKNIQLRVTLSKFPEEIRTRGRQLSWRMRGSIGSHVHRVQSDIVNLSTEAEVDDYVTGERSRIEAIQEWLNKAKIIVENKKRTEESCDVLYEQLKDKYLQQMNIQN